MSVFGISRELIVTLRYYHEKHKPSKNHLEISLPLKLHQED